MNIKRSFGVGQAAIWRFVVARMTDYLRRLVSSIYRLNSEACLLSRCPV